LPISEQIIRANLFGTGGTILCCRRALIEGLSMNLAGGFHHAFPDHAEGFCYINDIAVAIRRICADGQAARVAVVDLDVHQGNGTAFIFRADPSVFTFSMHQENLYPVKQRSSLDVGLEDGTGDEDFLRPLDEHLPKVLDGFRPQLVIYQAGADALAGDQLGGLALTPEGLQRRDHYVIGNCARRGIPIAGVLGGGYARNTQDTVRAHHATCRAMWSAG
jgi:acetoin utilization deacetylase AcuC-like enzyme